MSAQSWKLPCGDVFGRPREITVRVAKDHVVLGWPPGESATFARGELGQLARALDVADSRFQVDKVRRRRRAWLRGES